MLRSLRSVEDGSPHIIRRSGRKYVSVAQIRKGDSSEFLFSGKPVPALKSWERERHVVTVQIQEGTYEVPEHQRCRLEDM
jgi:hypothetical protein